MPKSSEFEFIYGYCLHTPLFWSFAAMSSMISYKQSSNVQCIFSMLGKLFLMVALQNMQIYCNFSYYYLFCLFFVFANPPCVPILGCYIMRTGSYVVNTRADFCKNDPIQLREGGLCLSKMEIYSTKSCFLAQCMPKGLAGRRIGSEHFILNIGNYVLKETNLN